MLSEIKRLCYINNDPVLTKQHMKQPESLGELLKA